ncbi:invasion protein [Salmonella enterica subsp. enterica serovar Typhimurium]|nr:invasion protein [Salmonella enterica subsp. enterica serovar Typhimurium]
MTWELILDGYSESSYSATPRFAAARLPWFAHFWGVTRKYSYAH